MHYVSVVAVPLFLTVVGFTGPVAGQEFAERFELWPIDLKIRGTIVAASDLSNVAIVKETLRRSDHAGQVGVLVEPNVPEEVVEKYRDVFHSDDDGDDAITIERMTDDPAGQIERLVADRDILCWIGSTAVAAEQQRTLRPARDAFAKHLDSGGTIIAIGAVAELLSDYFYSQADTATSRGLNLVPNCAMATNYDDSAEARGQLLSILARHPRTVGIGIAKNTAVVLAGRKMRVVGMGAATFWLMANEWQPLRVQSIAQQKSPRQPPEEYLIDLTEWRRDAIDRTLEPFPPAEPKTPFVEHGTLVIVGGGGMPDGLMDHFIELAGGREQAKLVYIPCSEQDHVADHQRQVEQWHEMGVKHATFIHTKDRKRANTDAALLAPLRDATGIWFGGGRQWNFADSYYGTEVHRLMKNVLRRGGVIGGSSAGASIQARYLARATPIGNFRIMAPGYERGGLGFISGVAIDQHFSQRGRQKDMTQLVNRYPQLLGIGIDEATAISVRKSISEVVGKGKVQFYDRHQPVYPDRLDYIALPAGSRYDLAERKVLEAAP